jgi:rhodanese-related sulfurtransferase
MNTITPKQLYELSQRGEPVELIDVRTPAEFRALHVPFARNVPLDRLDSSAVLQARNGSAAQQLYVICQGGGRGAKACAALAAVGCSQVINVEGGTAAWASAGLPVTRGRGAISMERQVRIAAGLLVLVGSALGYFVHPYFIALPAFVGAGLTFAGITDTCGMAMLLARMPWNQLSNNDAACCSR